MSTADNSPDSAAAVQARLVASLREPARHHLPAGEPVEVIETHISYVVLAGDWAYKIKKPLDLGFLDFTSLDRRRHFCEEEVRLNKRLAPAVYVDVVAITGDPEQPTIGGPGDAIEYAVRMRRFSQEALFGRLLATGRLRAEHIDALARLVADFHATASIAPADGPYGHVDRIGALALANLDAVDAIAVGPLRTAVEEVRQWSTRELTRLTATFEQRVARGRVRECHGDLHLGNIALVEGVVTVFDCIEFSDTMRWVDVVSEVAFTVMDLEDRGSAALGYRYLDAYLSASGDYDGLRVLPFYLAYRAMVRAKIAALRVSQVGNTVEGDARRMECAAYVALARRYALAPAGGVVVMHGLSGSGKTTLAGQLVERLPGIRVRTDVERRRVRAAAGPAGGTSGSPYSEDETRSVYSAVHAAVASAVAGGFVAVADGAFLRRTQRDDVRALAARLGVPCVLVSTEAPLEILRARVAARQAAGQDASEADLRVLAEQLAEADELNAAERAGAVVSQPDTPLADVVAGVRAHLARA